MVESDTAITKIIAYLEKAYLPLTAKEMSLIAKIPITTSRTTLQNLANSGEIQRLEAGPGLKNFYMHRTIEKEGDITFLVIGQYFKENLFQCVGFINFYDLRKICGIHRFQTGEQINKAGVQRQKHDKWVKDLEEALKSKDAEMWSTAIIFFEKRKVDYVKLKDYGDLEIGTIVIEYDGHIFDQFKPGWILDGQQRMWALERIALTESNPDALKLIGPVAIAIGDYKKEDMENEIDFIRTTFNNANNTQPLPVGFRELLLGTLKETSQEILTLKDKKKSFIAALTTQLNIDNDSPFKGMIDMTKTGMPRKDGTVILIRAMSAVLKEILEYGGLYKEDLPIHRSDDRFKFNIELIKDYFNAIKFTFSHEWEKPSDESRIRSRLVLSSFARLITEILHIPVARSPNRQERFKKIVRELIKLSDDEEISFDISSSLILNLKNNLADIKKLTERLMKIYTANSQAIPNNSQIQEIYDEWISSYPSIKSKT